LLPGSFSFFPTVQEGAKSGSFQTVMVIGLTDCDCRVYFSKNQIGAVRPPKAHARAQIPHMKDKPLQEPWRSIALGLLGWIVLTLIIFVCFDLHTRLAIVALLCLLTIVVISLQGRFFAALFCSVLATLGLAYFFMHPVFTLAVTRPEDIAALLTFLTITVVVSALGSKLRKSYCELAQENAERKRAEEQSKVAEEAWREAQAQLAHLTRMATLGELAGSIAHEVNQPLGAIANNARAGLRFLESGSEHLPDVKAALADIVKAADRVNGINVRMRALAKKVPPEVTELNFTDVVTDVLTLIHHELTRRQVETELELWRELPPVLADRVQVQQVLLNLVMNSVEAMNDVAGVRKIWIRTQPYEYNGSCALLVSVQDSGSGLKQTDFDRLFDAFYTTKPQGLGLGLSISRSIIEAHGGRLWARANVRQGALFQFMLPIADK
jgi:C4-dicarboxylate-specific signal transduction histidine kinase